MMPAVPLPFVVALLLGILLFRLVKQNDSSLRPAIAFTSACVALVTIVGLRWTFTETPFFRFLLPVVASLLPPIAWCCFTNLTREESRIRWPHFIPSVLILIFSASWKSWHPPIDLILACLYFGYGIALIKLVGTGPDKLLTVRFTDAPLAYRATLLAAGVLIISGITDLLIAGDLGFFAGTHAVTIAAVAQLLLLPALVYSVVVIGHSISQVEETNIVEPLNEMPVASEVEASKVESSEVEGTEVENTEVENTEIESTELNSKPSYVKPASEKKPEPVKEPSPNEEDRRIFDTIDHLMRQQQLYRDVDLNLNRLARRAGIPSRQISAAINRILGRNVSQVVNEYRIEEAKRLLADATLPITTVMLEAGFQTKSNFNREFQRVVGMTPSDYRRSVSPSEVCKD